jgi:hypothetical protein
MKATFFFIFIVLVIVAGCVWPGVDTHERPSHGDSMAWTNRSENP